ncbi:class GN sortase [Microbulbifer sp. CAU 1566]|uniref:class GN sortase n=1 Tax=Microbulbifer sp. CAU 1566 TaxID=2933269 RepID=UPI002006113F|nr:class GN sortase [Microbulbifer sp. CAU 1566]MCK7596019.1 class GN sortase [Microbulbifer sp. CAU 1566]
MTLSGKGTRWLSRLLICTGLWQLGSGSWLWLKAELAQYLISDSWQRQIASGEIHKPWPWADTWPVARLQLGDEKPLVVLEGASGQALAFGPGMVQTDIPSPDGGAAAPITVIAAHRDTHFRGLERLHPGSPVQLQGPDGRWQRYAVREARVVDSRSGVLPSFSHSGNAAGVMLVTCYPFDAVDAGGPLRYLVYAEHVDRPAVVESMIESGAESVVEL